MRFSPSFGNSTAIFIPRPSIPLEIISLAPTKPKLAVVSPKKTPMFEPVEISSFFTPTHNLTQTTSRITKAKVSKPIQQVVNHIEPPPPPKIVPQTVLNIPPSTNETSITFIQTPPPMKIQTENKLPEKKSQAQEFDELQQSVTKELSKLTEKVTRPSPVIALTLQPQPPLVESPRTTQTVTSYPTPKKQEVEEPKEESFFIDYFLIRVKPNLNPYHDSTRARVIMGIKIAGLLLLILVGVLGLSNFTNGFNINVFFEAVLTFVISGILLYLGEHFNILFLPINPYKIREVV